MEASKKKKVEIDSNTKQYIKRLRMIQLLVFVLMCITFFLFAQVAVINNRESLREVALNEVQESMKETVNNLTIHIDTIQQRIEKEVDMHIRETIKRVEKTSITNLEDVLFHIDVCDENRLGLAVQAVYIAPGGIVYHIGAEDREVTNVELPAIQNLYENAAICERVKTGEQELILFVNQSDVDALVKAEIHAYIHSEYYEGNQYVWVNEIVNMEGGENYAIRRIHPNLVESEGEYLSTSIQDIEGNYPYLTELEGIRENGQIFQSYFFKNKVNDEITEKFSYSQYYEPFNWIIATGETLEEVYEYSYALNHQNVKHIMTLMAVFILIFLIVFGMMVNILGKQAQTYRGRLLNQAQILEEIYATMSVGLQRMRISDTENTILKINPKGLELLGVDSEEEFLERRTNNSIIDTIDKEDAEKLVESCKELEELWDSDVVECRVRWKDNTIHLLKVRNTLVDFEGNAKIIQRMWQDITEERRLQEQAIQEAEEKATLDPMTQIKNKKAIELITRARIKEAAEKKLPVAVGFVDIDNFRDYNTKYGHMQGDEVIKYVARVLKESVAGDVGRTGGDEFTFCVLNASYGEIEKSMQLMHKRLNEGIAILETGEIISTPCSIGVVIEQDENIDYDYVMKHSDDAMYAAKEKGKNTYHILINVK